MAAVSSSNGVNLHTFVMSLACALCFRNSILYERPSKVLIRPSKAIVAIGNHLWGNSDGAITVGEIHAMIFHSPGDLLTVLSP